MNYEFHVGDYVRTRAGYSGYIESIHDLLHGVTGLYVRFVDGDCYCFEVTNKTISTNFLRIGAYDFTKEEKKEIMRLSEDDSWLTFRNTNKVNVNLCYIIRRINELVDAVNELRDKEDEG